jgi:hypothetical protein
MKNNNFLNISKSINWIKDLFRNQGYWSNQAYYTQKAVTEGNIQKFEQICNGRNPDIDFSNLITHAILKDNLELFFKIEKKAIEAKKTKISSRNFENRYKNKHLKYLFYNEVIGTAIIRDNIELIKYLIQNKKIDTKEAFDGYAVFQMSIFKSDKILKYVLFDLNIAISDILMQKLECDPKGNRHAKTLDLIEKRNIYFELNKDLKDNQQTKKTKQNKI